MAIEKERGSILYEILIVLLILVLIGSILYPKSLWEKEAKNTELCRQRITSLLNAELLYLKYNDVYCDTIKKLISFFETHPVLQEFLVADTALSVQLLDFLKSDPRVLASLDTMISDTTLQAILESIKIDIYLADAIVKILKERQSSMAATIAQLEANNNSAVAIMESLATEFPALAIMNVVNADDSLRLAVKNLQPDIPAATFINYLRTDPTRSARIDSFTLAYINSLYLCPSVLDTYKLALIDTSVIKYINIACPIDRTHLLKLKNDFLRYRIGDLKLENHGKIEGGEKSWEKQL